MEGNIGRSIDRKNPKREKKKTEQLKGERRLNKLKEGFPLRGVRENFILMTGKRKG